VLVDFLPGTVGVVGLHCRGNLLGFVAKIALVDDAVFVHHERHYAGIPVFGGIGQKGESADQFASREIVERATFGRRALLCEDAVAGELLRESRFYRSSAAQVNWPSLSERIRSQ